VGTEEVLIYKDLTLQTRRMWNLKTKALIGATGTTQKSFTKYLSKVCGKHNIKERQKTAIVGTAHLIMKILEVKNVYCVK
jgi:hypothetical protein